MNKAMASSASQHAIEGSRTAISAYIANAFLKNPYAVDESAVRDPLSIR
jgi:predicted HD phosphohydrolase